jgi:hypothetical protein
MSDVELRLSGFIFPVLLLVHPHGMPMKQEMFLATRKVNLHRWPDSHAE